MTLPVTAVIEVRTTGSDTQCAGGFDPVLGSGRTDYSQQNSAQATGMATSVTTTVTATTGIFTSAMIGNYITDGTTFKVINGFTSSTIVTVDSSPSWTATIIYVGGALATPGKALAIYVAGNTIHAIGSSTITSSSTNIAGGRLNFNVTGSQTAFNSFIGHSSSRADSNLYVLTLGAGLATTALTTNNANSYNEIRNLSIIGNSTSGAAAILHGGRSNRISNLKVSGFSGGGVAIVSSSQNAALYNFEISGGNTGIFAALIVNGPGILEDGWIHGNAGRGVDISGAVPTLRRIASTDNTGTSGYGFHIQVTDEILLIDCVSWGNSKSNYFLQNSNPSAILDGCISGASAEYDFDNRSGPDAIVLLYCAAKTSTSGLYPLTPTLMPGFVTLTGVPFISYTSGDFSTNTTAGAGTFLRSNTRPLFLAKTTSYPDIGAVQHLGGGIPNLIGDGGLIVA